MVDRKRDRLMHARLAGRELHAKTVGDRHVRRRFFGRHARLNGPCRDIRGL